VTRTFTSR